MTYRLTEYQAAKQLLMRKRDDGRIHGNVAVSIIQETCTDAYNDLDVTSVLPTRVGKLAPEACVNLAITRLPHACREADSLLREVSPTCTRKLVEE